MDIITQTTTEDSDRELLLMLTGFMKIDSVTLLTGIARLIQEGRITNNPFDAALSSKEQMEAQERLLTAVGYDWSLEDGARP